MEYLFKCDIPFLKARMKAPVAGGNAKPTCFVDKKAGWIGFIKNQDIKEENSHLKYTDQLLEYQRSLERSEGRCSSPSQPIGSISI